MVMNVGDTLANFRFERHFERRDIPIGEDNILDLEWIPAGSVPGMQSFDFTFFSEDDVEFDEFGMAFLTCFWFPLFESDAFTMPTDWYEVYELMQKRLGKVEDVHPAYPVTVPYDMDPYDAPDADGSLIYRPDRISLRALEASQVVMPYTLLYRRLLRFGAFSGGSYRTGDAAKLRYLKRVQGAIQRVFQTQLPGVMVWILTIPPAADADYQLPEPLLNKTDSKLLGLVYDTKDEYISAGARVDEKVQVDLRGTDNATNALSLETWTDYEFLAPKVNPVTGEKVYPTGLSMVNSMRKLMLQFYAFSRVTGGVDHSLMYSQKKISAVWSRDITFMRDYSTPSSISAGGAG